MSDKNKIKTELIKELQVSNPEREHLHEKEKELTASKNAEETGKTIIDAIGIADLNLRTKDVNKAWLRMFGYTKEEIIGRPVINFDAERDRAVLMKLVKEDIEKGIPRSSVCVALDKAGREFPVETSVFLRKDENGNSMEFIIVIRDITERKRAEETLRVSEVSYRELAESISDVFFAMDTDLRYTYWNKASENLTEISAKDALGKSILEIFPDNEGTGRAVALYREVLKTQQPNTFVNDYQLGGKDYVFEVSAYPSKTGLSVFVKDITEHKKAEEALKKWSHDLGERVKELNCLYAVSQLIAEPDNSLNEIFQETVNLIPASWQYPEITCAKIVFEGQEFKTANFKETSWKQSAEIIVSGDKVGALEVYYLEERPEIDEGLFLKEERNLIEALVKQLGYISECKRAEESLRESEERLTGFMESATDSFSLWDSKLNLADINEAGVRMFPPGTKKEDLVGKNILDITPGLQETGRYDKYLGVIRTGEPFSIDDFIPRPKFGDVYLAVRAFKAGDGLGIIATDITERKKMEEELKRYTEHLEEEVQYRIKELIQAEKLASIGQLAAGVAHEINTPLTNISLYAQMLTSNVKDEKAKEYLEIINSQVDSAAKIVSSLLDYSRISQMERVNIDINEVVLKASRIVRHQFELDRIEFKTDLEKNLPLVFADPNQIQQVILNLIMNAHQAIKKGRSISIITEKFDDNMVQIKISDTGEGIPKNNQNKIFEPFFTSKDGGGTGLGLSICKEIIDSHDGTIEFESREGKGTTFFVRLPIKE